MKENFDVKKKSYLNIKKRQKYAAKYVRIH